jgi:hypothetical protein
MFVSLKSLGGQNYVLPHRVLALTSSDPTKCVVVMEGGVQIAVSEPIKEAMVKIQAALETPDQPAKEP